MKKLKKFIQNIPHKKVIILAIICAVVLGGIIYSKYSKKPIFSFLGNKGKITSKTTIKEVIERDSDGDGIADWEEALWGTDPNNPDTNGDGISDNIEINNKREQLKKENAGVTYDENGLVATNENLSETDKFAREFFTTITALKQAGQLNEISLANLAGKFMEIISSEEIPIRYGTAEIKTIATSVNSINTFTNNLGAIVENYVFDLGGEEEIIYKIISEERPMTDTEAKTFEKISLQYKELSEKILALTVPGDLKEEVLDVANNAYATGEILSNLKVKMEDSLNMMRVFLQYQNQSNKFASALDILNLEAEFLKDDLTPETDVVD